MLIYLDDLRKESWFTKLPEKFRKLGRNDFYVFKYSYDFENTRLNIDSDNIMSNINVFLYSDIYGDYNLGYFRQPFNTKDTLFYYLLKTYIGEDAKTYILQFKQKDEEQLKQETPKYQFGDVEIKDRINYQEAVSKFILKGGLINPIMTISDLFDGYLIKKHNKSLYGQTIKKFVRLIKHTAEAKKGNFIDLYLIPEEKGQVRYMFVGENSEVYKNSESIKKAKEMLRLKYSEDRIFKDTGWYFNTYDSKFRKVVDDAGFKIKANLVSYQDTLIYYPENCPIPIEEIYFNCSKKPRTDNWINYIKKGYNGKLGDCLEHPTLFKNYPQLYNLPFYYVKKLNGSDGEDNYSYRYNPKDKDIVMCGYSKSIELILLHEIQHAIQDIEGFSSGGNMFLAEMINTVGGGDIRDFVIHYPKIQEKFCESISDKDLDFVKKSLSSFYRDAELDNLSVRISNIIKSKSDNEKAKNLMNISQIANGIQSLFDKSNNKEEAIKNCNNIIYHIILIKHYIHLSQSSEISSYFNNIINLFGLKNYYSVISDLSQTIFESSKYDEVLKSKGFAPSQRALIKFQSYLNIFGELEARTVSNIAYLEQDLREYLLPYTSESLDFKNFSVIIDSNQTYKTEKIIAGIEKTNEDKYILHLTPTLSSVPFIHEFGHLVYDFISDGGLNSFINEIYLEYSSKYKDVEEFFCDYFSSYLYRLNINESLTNDLTTFSDIPKIEKIDFILDTIFNLKDEVEIGQKYVEYLKQLL
jgi:hypothetical protein